jgi:hypothetical protein
MPEEPSPARREHTLLRARDWQHRPQLDMVCEWWRSYGAGLCALVGIGGAGKTAIADRFLQLLPGVLPDNPRVPKDNGLPTPRDHRIFSFCNVPNPDEFFRDLADWLVLYSDAMGQAGTPVPAPVLVGSA